jgi:hypothetical protein
MNRLDRIRQEAVLTAARFSETKRVRVDPDGRWAVLYDFRLPPLFNYRTVDVLIELPPDYPLTPPQWFYTDPGLRRSDGGPMPHYLESRAVRKAGWAACCLHVRTWRPAPDPLRGHSLLTVGQLIWDAFNRWGR